MKITTELVQAAQKPTSWDFGNQVLYDLCRDHPGHACEPAVIAKVWLIGRSYAAAIERRRKKTEKNDDFYVEVVGPVIARSNIDKWIKEVSEFADPTPQSITTILSTHALVTNLFRRISGLDKRSLASKYLHFHKPNLFYLYDTRAVEGMKKLELVVARESKTSTKADHEYQKFAQKCLLLQEHVSGQFGVHLTPREVDKLLLNIHASEN